MRYDKLVEMMKKIASEKLAEDIKHRSASQSQSMRGRYSRHKNEIRLAQEDKVKSLGKTDTGSTAIYEPNPVINSIDQSIKT